MSDEDKKMSPLSAALSVEDAEPVAEEEVTQEVTEPEKKGRGRKKADPVPESVTVEVRAEKAPPKPKLSAQTLAEMEAGRQALARYK